MAIYTVELDGNQFDIEGPDGASEDDLLAAARQHQSGVQTPASEPASAEAAPSSEPAQPEESKSRRFVRKVANALPTVGGIGGGIALGVPGTVFGMGVGGVPSAAVGAGIGAAGGTAAKQLILRALGDTEGVPQTAGEAAKEIGIEGAKDAALTYTGGKLIKGGVKTAKLAKDLITKPGAQEVALAGKEALVDIAERGGEKLALARSVREGAKKGLIEAEEKAGLHFESTPGFEKLISDPKKMADFTSKIGRLAKRTPEELAQSVPSEQLQLFRKIAQEGEKVSTLSDIAKSQMRQGKDVFTQALGIKEKGVGEALGKFRDADKVVGEIPGQIKSQLTGRKLQSAREVLDAKSLDRKRKVVKGLAAAAAGYLGLKSLIPK
jgi:hypothetical protein